MTLLNQGRIRIILKISNDNEEGEENIQNDEEIETNNSICDNDLLVNLEENALSSDEEEILDNAIDLDDIEFTKVKHFEKITTQSFTSYSGPIKISEFEPFSLFRLFFTNKVFEIIANESNLNANQYFIKTNNSGHRYSAKSRNNTFFPISSKEIQSYIAILILAGIHRLPSIEDHWSTQDFLGSPISKIMSQNRFKIVSQFFICLITQKYLK